MRKDSIEERTRGSANKDLEKKTTEMTVEEKENQKNHKNEVNSKETEKAVRDIGQNMEKLSIRRPMLKRQDAFDHGAGV